MSIAELHGKLSPDSANDRQEDLLTSDAFGTMYYAGWQHGFLTWLLSAKAVTAKPPKISEVLGLDDARSVQSIKYSFWPTLINGREPDVALCFELINHSYSILVIEIKYLSGLSNYSVEEAIDDPDRSGHQLVNQLQGITATDPCELLRSWFGIEVPKSTNVPVAHLLITADYQLPYVTYSEVRHWFSRSCTNELVCPVYWLSWRTLASYLRPAAERAEVGATLLIQDLIRLLERKELTNDPFEGFIKLEWPSSNGLASFWKHERWFQTTRDSSIAGPALEGSFWKHYR